MAELGNPRWESFCQLKAIGKVHWDAYIAAGFTVNPGDPTKRNKIASTRASILLRDPRIKQRILEIEEELRTSVLAKAAVDRTYVVKNLKDNSEKAQAAKPVLDRQGRKTGEYKTDTAASNRALELLGKEVGMFQDKFDDAGLDDRIKNMTVLEVRNQIRAAATAVGLRMVEMDDKQLRTFILAHAERVGLRCVEVSVGDSGSGEAEEGSGVSSVSETSGVPSTRH